LEKLAAQAPIVDHILQYRQLAKLKSTYVEGLLTNKTRNLTNFFISVLPSYNQR